MSVSQLTCGGNVASPSMTPCDCQGTVAQAHKYAARVTCVRGPRGLSRSKALVLASSRANVVVSWARGDGTLTE